MYRHKQEVGGRCKTRTDVESWHCGTPEGVRVRPFSLPHCFSLFLTYLPTVNHSKGRLYKKHWKIIIPSYLKMNVLEWVCNYFFWTREIGKKHLFSLCALKIWCPCWLPSKERREKMSLKEKKLATLVELNTIIVKTQYSFYK